MIQTSQAAVVALCMQYLECGGGSNPICMLAYQKCALVDNGNLVLNTGRTFSSWTDEKHTFEQNGYSITYDPTYSKVQIKASNGADTGEVKAWYSKDGCLSQGMGCIVSGTFAFYNEPLSTIKDYANVACQAMRPQVYDCSKVVDQFSL